MIVKIKSKCETCAHEKICVKKDGMQTIEHEFDNILGSEWISVLNALRNMIR